MIRVVQQMKLDLLDDAYNSCATHHCYLRHPHHMVSMVMYVRVALKFFDLIHGLLWSFACNNYCNFREWWIIAIMQVLRMTMSCHLI